MLGIQMKSGMKGIAVGLLACQALVVQWGCGGSERRTGVTPPHNLVVIVSDALRRDVLGCYGGSARTPHIDRLAREGTLFENAYSTAPCTLPSSVAMLTGNYSRTYSYYIRREIPGKNKALPWKQYCFYVPDAEWLLAESLVAAGWMARAAIGNSVVERSNILQGFTRFPKKGREWRKRAGDSLKRMGVSLEKVNHRQEFLMLEFLWSVSRSQRFFLLHWILDPHAPYASLPQRGEDLSGMERTLPHPPEFYASLREHEMQKLYRAGSLSDAEMNYIRRRYRAEVESVDERVGMILEILESRKLLADTLIVFTSDHGELLGGHGFIGHGRSFYQELVRVPLIFRGPGVERGRRVFSRVSHLDLTPTLADLCHAPVGDRMGGSYSHLFRVEDEGVPLVYFDAVSNSLDPKWAGWDAILGGKYKLVVNRKAQEIQKVLYNLQEDPGEMVDRAADFFQRVDELSRQIARLRATIRTRLEHNASRLREKLDLNNEARKARETLKSLGYL